MCYLNYFEKGNEIHIWPLFIESHSKLDEKLVKVLSQNERERAGRFKRFSDSQKYTIFRSYLKHILGFYLYADPDEIEIDYHKFGKPFIKKPIRDQNLYFNLSHSQNGLIIACSFMREIGIDLEYPSTLNNMSELAKIFMSPHEYQNWRKDGCKQNQFYRYWVLKEAYLKGLGTGLLNQGCRFVEFNIDASWNVLPSQDSEEPFWYVGEIPIFNQYLSAIAIKSPFPLNNPRPEERKKPLLFSDISIFNKGTYWSLQL